MFLGLQVPYSRSSLPICPFHPFSLFLHFLLSLGEITVLTKLNWNSRLIADPIRLGITRTRYGSASASSRRMRQASFMPQRKERKISQGYI
ncbi:uncharacterized protein BO97DRAFT_224089 [Aspergillus homomorphus CBS 101889]|uniref:Uncharacterized protein n=1 Tax=Aspergillus homomorphus (strain CBS 101889) TaxID=1450537 RepID=A0A395HPW0_ASPHC|nr:hypothetical protein BO97DRAFT_224089 [Aspergillus homomorphus CBS 101889]RAL08284.1 hypothetical protein BO97DRAFT_224089 [Aspergillus homomorphus CBS 101889]